MLYKSASVKLDSPDAKKNAVEAVARLKTDLFGFNAGALLFFASPVEYDPATIAKEMQNAFPEAITFGCSSAGELATGKMFRGALTCMAFAPEVFEKLAVVGYPNIDSDDTVVDRGFAELGKQLGEEVRHLDFRKYLGFVLIDGVAMAMEKVTDRIGELTDVIFTGGCAGDDIKFEKTWVYANGIAYENGTVMALMKPSRPFTVLKTQSLVATDRVLTATSVDDANNVIRTFDDKPAADMYAEAMGIPVEQMSAENFAANPLALMAGGEPFVRNAAHVVPGGGIRLHTRPREGMRYTVTKGIDIINDTKEALARKKEELGSIGGAIVVNCLFRDLQVRNNGTIAEHEQLYADFPMAGFSSFGEIYIGVVNQTATMVLFG
ncbi:MAG: FIST C-terminal domain-containing protein [Planctomycetes bacterium]|nr:FIST C-terminal domain-containing protein [Planctomycetota bacterium]